MQMQRGILTTKEPIVVGLKIGIETPILVLGKGSVRLLRSVGSSEVDNYHPVTDLFGNQLLSESVIEDGVIFNSDISNHSQYTHFGLELISGKVVTFTVGL